MLTLCFIPTLAAAENKAEISIDPAQVINSKIYGFGHVLTGHNGLSALPKDEQEIKKFYEIFDDHGPGGFWRVTTALMFFEPFNDNNDPWLANLKDGFSYASDFEKRPDLAALSERKYYTGMSDREFMKRSWDGLIQMLDYCESKGVTVALTHMVYGPLHGDPKSKSIFRHWDPYCWLGETEYGQRNGKRPNYSDDFGWMFFERTSCNDYPYDIEEFGEAMAGILYYLKVVKNYKCVEFFSIFNEPTHVMASPGLNNPDSHQELFASVDRHLRNFTFTFTGDKKDAQSVNLRDKIKLITDDSIYHYHDRAGDDDNQNPHPIFSSSISSPEELLPWIITNKNKKGRAYTGDTYLDGFGDHGWHIRFDFDAQAKYYDQYGLLGTIGEYCGKIIPKYLQDIKTHSKRPKELLYMEGGYFVGESKNWKPFEFIQVEEAIRMMAAGGMKGHARWRTDDDFILRKDKAYVPWRYYPYALLTHYVKKGSDVLKTTIKGQIKDSSSVWPATGEAKEAQRIWPAAFKSPDGKISLVIVNDSANPADLSIQIPSAKELEIRKYYVYDSNPADEKITAGLDKISSGNKGTQLNSQGDYSVSYSAGKTTIQSKMAGCSIEVYTELQ